MNTTIAQLLERKSVRRFSGEPVTQAEFHTVIECAMAAPTAGNMALYTIVNITDQQVKDELADLCDNQPFIAKAPVVLLFLADCRRWVDAFEVAGCQPHPPGPGDLYLGLCDALIAAQNAVTAAHALGLGSCYIGDIVEHRDRLVSLLDLDEYTFPATLLVLGHPSPHQRRPKPKRFPVSAILRQERYRRLAPDEQRAAFAARGEDFDTFVPAFHDRKYASAFEAELNAGVAAYLAPFLRTAKTEA
ncbi:MAG: nitroreductase family protein [Propionibacteriaceae bacterium]|jgi:nitroreductase|nr:nitroreductase family protein [Propionibacteriaceae bacterium]